MKTLLRLLCPHKVRIPYYRAQSGVYPHQFLGMICVDCGHVKKP